MWGSGSAWAQVVVNGVTYPGIGFRVWGVVSPVFPWSLLHPAAGDPGFAPVASSVTAEHVDWFPEPGTNYQYPQYAESPDLSAIVRELQARPGWEVGDPVAFVMWSREMFPHPAWFASVRREQTSWADDRYFITANALTPEQWAVAYPSTPYMTFEERSPRLIVEYGLNVSAGPVVGGEVTLSGTRPVDATITVSCPTATVGAVSYPTATTWEVTAEILGTGTFTVSDGTDTVYVEVSGDILGASAVAASLGVVASSSDAYYLARNYAVGLSQLAGSWAYIDWPQGAFGQRARFGVAPSSAFAAAWADATAQAHAMGFASLSAFAAFWANAHAEAASFGCDAVSDYAIADKDNRADGTVFGFESGAAFSAAWASAQSVAARLGFSSVSAFVAVWEEAATTAARFGLDCTAVWYSEDSGVATVGGIFGVRASAFYTPRGWDGTPTKVDLFDRSTRMVLTGRNATTALGDRSTRVLLTERSDD
jgi:hypothetical protein